MFQESYAAAYTKRYGVEPTETVDKIGGFLTHRSIRTYRDEAIPDSIIEGLVAAAQSAATSSNLQLWSIVSVQDPDRRAAIATLCADQDQVRKAPWFLVFVADQNRLYAASKAQGEPAESLDTAEFYTMSIVDAALAAERMVCAAEALGIGICYIGALRDHPAEIASLLNLPRKTFGVFGLCLGYPEVDATAEIKPRLAQQNVWFRESYGATDPAEYDERMRVFYEEMGMKGEFTWSMRSARRLSAKALGTRGGQLDFLHQQGFLLR